MALRILDVGLRRGIKFLRRKRFGMMSAYQNILEPTHLEETVDGVDSNYMENHHEPRENEEALIGTGRFLWASIRGIRCIQAAY